MSRVLITGASKGIGLALAHEFARHGHDLIITSRDHDLLNQVSHNLKKSYSVQVDYLAIDLRLDNSVKLLTEEISARGHSLIV